MLSSRGISQDDIERLIAVENQIRELERDRDRLCGSIISRRMAGASVEPGMFRVEIETDEKAGKRSHRLVVR